MRSRYIYLSLITTLVFGAVGGYMAFACGFVRNYVPGTFVREPIPSPFVVGWHVFLHKIGIPGVTLVGLLSGLAVGYWFVHATLNIRNSTAWVKVCLGAFYGMMAGSVSAACTVAFDSSNVSFGIGLISVIFGGFPGLVLGIIFSAIIVMVQREPCAGRCFRDQHQRSG